MGKACGPPVQDVKGPGPVAVFGSIWRLDDATTPDLGRCNSNTSSDLQSSPTPTSATAPCPSQLWPLTSLHTYRWDYKAKKLLRLYITT